MEEAVEGHLREATRQKVAGLNDHPVTGRLNPDQKEKKLDHSLLQRNGGNINL